MIKHCRPIGVKKLSFENQCRWRLKPENLCITTKENVLFSPYARGKIQRGRDPFALVYGRISFSVTTPKEKMRILGYNSIYFTSLILH